MTGQSDLRPHEVIGIGEFYEDCRYHPVLCVRADYSEEGDELVGTSRVGGGLGSCSPRPCGVVKLTPDEAIGRRVNWPSPHA